MEPRKVILFSGHMIDKPDRKQSRFPPELEPVVSKEIEKVLNSWDPGPDDVTLCGGACGGDIIFAELCLNKGTRLEIRIPFEESEFLRESVTFAGDQWRDRFYIVKDHPNTNMLVMTDILGLLPRNSNPYERNNLWQLQSAMAWNPQKVSFLCLWDGKEGDGPGGTKHMLQEVEKHSGKVHIVDIKKILFEEKNETGRKN